MSQFPFENMKQTSIRRNKKSGGRPRSDSDLVRHKTIGVRVNKSEWEELQKKSKLMGMSPAQWLRTASLQRRLPQMPIPETNRQAYAELMRLAVNLNQIARSANTGFIVAPMKLLRELQIEVEILQASLMGIAPKNPKEAHADDS